MPGPVRLTGAVITHPRRLSAARALADSAPPGFLDLVQDPDPHGPATGLRTSIRAWSQIPDGATHHLVLEDDARLGPGFREQAERAAAAAPDAALVLYNGWGARNGAVLRLAALAGARWAAPVAEYTANVALILPAAVGAGFGDFARAHGGTWPDDVILARYLDSVGVRTLMPVPNMVQHGELPSISGNELHGLRLSACYAPPPQDADWSADRLFEPEIVPFFKFGVAQCSIRHAASGPEAPGPGWLTVSADRAAARLGLDPDRCAMEFDSALAEPPGRALAGRLPGGKLAAHWRTGYALGLLAARHRSPAQWPGDPLAAAAVDTLGPGGLSMELTAGRVRELQAPLRELAWAAIEAGARQPEFHPVGRRVAVIGEPSTLRRVLAEDLADRGHLVTTDAQAAARAHAADVVVEPVGSDGAVEMRCTTPEGAPATLRLGVPYGPELPDDAPLGELILQSLTKQPMRARFASPEPCQYTHVWDVGQALAKLIETPGASGIFDVCHEQPVSPPELAELIAATLRKVDIDLEYAGDGSAAAPVPALSPRRAADALGWRPTVDLADGIRTLGQWLAYEAP